MKRPGLLRFIPFWPVILVILLALLWNQRINITTWVLDRVVIGGEIEDLMIAPKQIDLDRSLFTSMQFKTSIDGRRYQIDAENAEITYRFSDITSFSVDHVTLGRVRIEDLNTHSTSDRQTAEYPTIKTLLTVINQLQNLSLPFKTFVVQHLELSLPGNELAITEDAIALTAQDNGLQLRVVDGPRYLEASSEPGRLLFTLGSMPAQGDDVVHLEVVPNGSSGSITSHIKLNTQALGDWIQNYPTVAPLGKLLQSIEAQPSVVLELVPDDQTILVNVNAETDQIRAGDLNASEIRIRGGFIVDDGIFNEPEFRLETTGKTEIFASKIEFDALIATDLEFDPVGNLGVSANNITTTLITGSKLSAATMRYEDIEIQSLDLDPVMTLSNSMIHVDAGSRVHAKQLSIPDIMLSDLSSAPKTSAVIRLDTENGFEHKDGSWTVEMTFHLDDSNRVSGVVDADISHLDAESVSGRIISYRPEVSMDIDLPQIEKVTADIARNEQQVKVAGILMLEQSDEPMRFTISHEIETSIGDARLWNQTPIIAKELVDLAKSMQLELPDATKVEGGEGNVELTATWSQERLLLLADFELSDLFGLYQEAQFENMAVSGSLQVLPTLQSVGNISTGIDFLEYGVELRNLSSEFMLDESTKGELPELVFNYIQGEIFSSRFIAEEFSLDLNDPDTRLNLRVQDLDIEQVVATQGIEGLEATGRVDGNLPVTISSEGISIENGIFWNHLGGGNIVYTISDEQAAALENPLTDLVIKALRDFRYRILTAETNYYPNGDLHMNFQLKGISPQLDSKRPVHLNINSEQNVLSLLKSLSYSEGVNRALDKQIQEKFE